MPRQEGCQNFQTVYLAKEVGVEAEEHRLCSLVLYTLLGYLIRLLTRCQGQTPFHHRCGLNSTKMRPNQNAKLMMIEVLYISGYPRVTVCYYRETKLDLTSYTCNCHPKLQAPTYSSNRVHLRETTTVATTVQYHHMLLLLPGLPTTELASSYISSVCPLLGLGTEELASSYTSSIRPLSDTSFKLSTTACDDDSSGGGGGGNGATPFNCDVGSGGGGGGGGATEVITDGGSGGGEGTAALSGIGGGGGGKAGV